MFQLMFYDERESIWRHSFFATYIVLDVELNQLYPVGKVFSDVKTRLPRWYNTHFSFVLHATVWLSYHYKIFYLP